MDLIASNMTDRKQTTFCCSDFFWSQFKASRKGLSTIAHPKKDGIWVFFEYLSNDKSYRVAIFTYEKRILWSIFLQADSFLRNVAATGFPEDL
jgi:hypothetical protein